MFVYIYTHPGTQTNPDVWPTAPVVARCHVRWSLEMPSGGIEQLR